MRRFARLLVFSVAFTVSGPLLVVNLNYHSTQLQEITDTYN